MEDELDPAGAEAFRLRGGGEAVLELTPPEPADSVVVRVAFDLGLVDLAHAVARVREPVSKRTVIREQERAGRVGVEAADRHHALLVADEAHDVGRPCGSRAVVTTPGGLWRRT